MDFMGYKEASKGCKQTVRKCVNILCNSKQSGKMAKIENVYMLHALFTSLFTEKSSKYGT